MKVLLCGKCGNFEGSPKVEKKKKGIILMVGHMGFMRLQMSVQSTGQFGWIGGRLHVFFS